MYHSNKITIMLTKYKSKACIFLFASSLILDFQRFNITV